MGSRWSRFAALPVGALTAVVIAGTSLLAGVAERAPDTRAAVPATTASHWVDSWASMPQLTEPGNLPPAPFTQDGLVLADATLRQTIHLSVGGKQHRLRLSNAFGGAVLPITAASVALPVGGQAGVSAIQPGSAHPVTFSGRTSVNIPVGAQVVSDPIEVDLPAQANLTITLYLAQGQASNNVTSHPGSRTTSYITAGNHVNDLDLPGATSTAHWYFISALEMWKNSNVNAVAIVGDSLTDGRGSTTNGNDRWPDQLLARLQADRATADVAVINQAAGGNRVLNDGLGPNALGRIDRDVIAQSGVKWMILFEGVNDIGTAEATPAAQKAVTDELIFAYDQIVTRAHAKGIRVYGGTITPFGGNTGYDDPAGTREAARQAVNGWIRTSGRFDAVIDFDKAARDPDNPRQLLPAFDTGDHLHLNPTGYKALADAVPAKLFRDQPAPDGWR